MAGFTDLLGSLIESGLSGSGSSRIGNALGAGGGGSLGDIIGNLSDILGGKSASSGGLDLGSIIKGALSGLSDNKAALGGLGALGGALLGGGGRSAKGALGGGALAMLASVAFSALKNGGQKPSPMPLAAQQGAAREEQVEKNATRIIKAMINAAKADGAIDQQEMNRIIGKFEEDGLSQQEKDFFMTESAAPLDLQGVIDSAEGSPEIGAAIYAASLLAIEVDTQAEQQYLQSLAAGLGLNHATVGYIESTFAK
jgi:uncharacterized membrane protein YebE (DUF533 family)